MPRKVGSKLIVEIAGSAAVGFVLTTLYLQQASEPPIPLTATRMVNTPSPLTLERIEPPPTPQPVNASAATGSPKAVEIVTPIAAKSTDSPPDDESTRVDRRELEEYFGGVQSFAPLTPEQKSALVESKFRYRRILTSTLKDAGLARESLSSAERSYAHTAARQALIDFHNDFLMDVKPLLNERQYTALSDFESTEYRRRLASLQADINSK